jgi:tripartite-type tricarboxylate transporter receptor subunit TctC
MLKTLLPAALALAAALAPLPSPAQDGYPSKPIRLIVPFAAGGSADVVGRLMAEELRGVLGQPVVVENRPGAGAQIALEAVAKAVPDGLTIGLSPVGPLVVNPVLTPARMPYDAANDFTVLTHVWDQPNILVASLAVPAEPQAFLAWLRARPEEPFASVGNGSSNHLTGELISRALGLRMQHVVYRGSPAALTEVVAGRINLFVDNIVTAIPLVRDGRIRAIAVTTERRAQAMPDVPTMAEIGVPQATVSSWQVVLGPARLPPAIVERYSTELDKAIRAPEMVAWMNSIGAQAIGGGAPAAQAMVARERVRWARDIPPMNISVD